MKNVVICDMKRSAFARGGKGKLVTTRLDTLSAQLVTQLLEQHPTLKKTDIEEFGLGQVLHADELLNMGSAQIAHLSGLPYEMSKFEVNRQCGSSMEVVHRMTHAMMLGLYDTGIAIVSLLLIHSTLNTKVKTNQALQKAIKNNSNTLFQRKFLLLLLCLPCFRLRRMLLICMVLHAKKWMSLLINHILNMLSHVG